MRFSVIIPCYNAAETIVRALDSLVLQSFSNWEVICIDDCSKDNTIEVIKAYKDTKKEERITILCNEKNIGPGASRNHGIAIAKGEYFCFLDADDFYDHAMLQILDLKIQETNADIVFYGFNQIIGNTTRKRHVRPRNDISEYIALVSGSLCMAVWKHQLWKGIEMPPINNAEDIAIIPILVSRAKQILTIDNILYNYVHSNKSTSSRHQPQVSYNFVSSFHYTLQHIDVERFHDPIEFHGIKTIVYGATLNAIKAGMKNREIKQLWVEFFQLFPHWTNNVYLKSYAHSKRVFVWFAAHQYFTLMCCYAKLHNALLKLLG